MDLAGRKPDKAWLGQVIDTIGLRDRLDHPLLLAAGQFAGPVLMVTHDPGAAS